MAKQPDNNTLSTPPSGAGGPDIILKAENISKQYRLGQVGTVACLELVERLSHDLNRWRHQVRGKEDPYLKIGDPSTDNYRFELAKHTNDRSTKSESDYVWALQDINFEVKKKRQIFKVRNCLILKGNLN